MTSVEDRIATITARAAARGLRLAPQKKTQGDEPAAKFSAVLRVARPAAQSKPAKPSVLTRPLPCNWSGASYSDTGQKRNAETRVAAWLIAKSLGSDWRKQIDQNGYWRSVTMVRTDGVTLRISTSHSNGGRYTISLDDVRGNITVSASRSPLSIAGDIERRLLTAENLAAIAKAKADAQARRNTYTRERLTMLRVAQAADDVVLNKNDTNCGHPATRTIYRDAAIIDAEICYDGRISLTVQTLTIELAEAVAELAANWPAPAKGAPTK